MCVVGWLNIIKNEHTISYTTNFKDLFASISKFSKAISPLMKAGQILFIQFHNPLQFNFQLFLKIELISRNV